MDKPVESDPAVRPVAGPAEPTAFERFESLAKRLLHVSKDDVREAEARDQNKRRTA